MDVICEEVGDKAGSDFCEQLLTMERVRWLKQRGRLWRMGMPINH